MQELDGELLAEMQTYATDVLGTEYPANAFKQKKNRGPKASMSFPMKGGSQ
jgi:hypothetical protein